MSAAGANRAHGLGLRCRVREVRAIVYLVGFALLCAAAPASAQPSVEVLFDEDDPTGIDYFDASTGEAAGGDFLLLIEDGKMPIETERAFSGTTSGLLEYRHIEGGTWRLAISPEGRDDVDLSRFDSLVVHLNGPEALAGAELPRVGLEGADGSRSALRSLSPPRNVEVDPASSGFSPESTTNVTLSARYVEAIPSELRRPGYPEDLVLAFADESRDTSVAGIGAPATAAHFTVETASGRRLAFRFRDPDTDGTFSAAGEYVEVLLPESEEAPDHLLPTWRIEYGGTDDGQAPIPPGVGDVYRLSVRFDELALDDDPETWQRVSIPLIDLPATGDFSLASFASVLFANGSENPETRTLWVDRIEALRNDDEAFLDMVQRATFDYFWFEANPQNGLIRDRSRPTSASSIAAVGFGLSAYVVGIERGWITREQGVHRVLTTLRFFWNAPQGTAPDATGYRGFFYHFLEMNSGRRAGTTELSTIDTALLLAGVLHMRTYFTGDNPEEEEIRALADSIYERVDWPWAQVRSPWMGHGWRPETGHIGNDYRGYNEAMILYLLALGSPTHPVGAEAWGAWASTYSWATHFGYSFVPFPPLFGHQYTHVWVDFRGIQDDYMRGRGIDYFENSRRATLAQRAYHIANPRGWPNYGRDEWGLTASDTPTGYRARGAPPAQNDDGTLVPTAPGGSTPFTPEESIAALRHMHRSYPNRLWGPYGFRDAYNVSANWFDPEYLGIDQGPILLMIENYRTGRIWEDFMQHEAIQRALQRAGFEPTDVSSEPDPVPQAEATLTLYPNPAGARLFAELGLSVAGPVRVRVFDVLGREVSLVREESVSSRRILLEIPSESLAAGVYFVQVDADGVLLVKSFVKAHED